MYKMKSVYGSLVVLCAVIVLSLSGCGGLERDSSRLQKQLHKQMDISLERTEQLVTHLHNSFDSIWSLTKADDDDPTLFFVFDNRRMVYWSDNWLAGQEVLLLRYDEWYYWRFQNAHCVCRWTKADGYNVLTVIPVKYAYSIENKQLRNSFVRPLSQIDNCDIIRTHTHDDYCILAPDGRYLFSVVSQDKTTVDSKTADNKLAQSFSYQALLADTNEQDGTKFYNNNRVYFALGIVIFAIVFIIGIIGLIRNHGFRNMRLQMKFTYAIVTLVLVNAVYVFVISVVHSRHSYETQQQHVLQRKTRYLQKALQDIYFWNVSLSKQNEAGMNIDLRDLSFAYEMDIHVYDMNGDLVGSSTPELFQQGLLSRHIAPEPFYSKSTMLRYEHIGDMKYLAAYTEFYNGNYVQIGYISVPLFISADEVRRQTDAFLAKLLPPSIILMLLSLFISILLARGMTQPLSVLANKMQGYRIGQRTNRLHYESNDEVGQLVARYNELMDELERSAEQLAKSEREGAWRTMSRQIAHEIKNPLTPMKLTIQQLQRMKKLGDERYDAYFEHSTRLLIEQIDNLSHIAQSFSSFAKIPEVVTSEVDVAQKLTSVISLFRNDADNVNIRYIGMERSVMVLADEDQIARVFTNLIKNALQAIEKKPDGDIIIMLKKLPNMVEISVSDNGGGIPEELQEKIFRPNFTTKSTGMGLGLPISKNIVEGSGGTITFKTSPQGTTFYVRLRYPESEKHQHNIIELEDE